MELNLASPATREIRRFLYSAVQDGWEYPPAPAAEPSEAVTNRSDPPATAPTDDPLDAPPLADPFRSSSGPDPAAEARVPLAYMARYYGSSDDTESESEASTSDARPESPGIRIIQKLRRSSRKERKDAFKFDSPESVGAHIQAKRRKRTLRREREMREECEWNEGLDLWVKRRDAWTNAVVRTGPAKEEKEDVVSPSEMAAAPELTINGEAPESPRDTTVPPLESTIDHPANSHEEDELSTPLSPLSRPSPTPDPDSEDQQTLLPVLPLIPPGLPARPFISQDALLPIYRALIINARTPPLPLPLPTVIAACIAGWIDSGEWPASAVPRSAARPSLPLPIPVSPTPLSPGFLAATALGGLASRPVPDGFFDTAVVDASGRKKSTSRDSKDVQKPPDRQRRRSSLARLIGIHDPPSPTSGDTPAASQPLPSPSTGPSPLSPHWVPKRGSVASNPGEGKDGAEERRLSHSSMRKGMESVKKALRIHTGSHAAGEGSGAAAAQGGG